jgi:hypothetical protein
MSNIEYEYTRDCGCQKCRKEVVFSVSFRNHALFIEDEFKGLKGVTVTTGAGIYTFCVLCFDKLKDKFDALINEFIEEEK